jgi:6-phosphogluconolactonase
MKALTEKNRAAPPWRIVPDAQALYREAAQEFLRRAQDAVRARGRFMVALSGGSTPRGLYSLLADDVSLARATPWDKVHFFWGDERQVPPDHSDSNFRMAWDALLSRVPVRCENIHRVRGENPDAAKAASDYEQSLRQVFGTSTSKVPRFDLILLGLGADGHTASLFAGTSALQEESDLVVCNWVEKLKTERITFTARLINHAAAVLMLVSGQDKAASLSAVLRGPHDPERFPAQLVMPHDGALIWLLDHSAARALIQPRNSS